MFKHNFTGVQESGEYTPIPDGTYILRIGNKEIKTSKNGYNQVLVELTVNEGEHKGRKLFHIVTFLPADMNGAGIAKRWLHAIGQEYEGEVLIRPLEWKGLVKCTIETEEYRNKNNELKKKNKVSIVHLLDIDSQLRNSDSDNSIEVSNDIDNVPF